MGRFHFPIRTTLFFIISVLNILITVQVGYTLYKSWLSHENAIVLQDVTRNVNLLLRVEKFLSVERGLSMSVVYAPQGVVESLRSSLKDTRRDVDSMLEEAFDFLQENMNEHPGIETILQDVMAQHIKLQEARIDIDRELQKGLDERDKAISNAFFNISTEMIVVTYNLIDAYSSPYMASNPAVVRQMRFSYNVWSITEYVGREYAILGQLIVEKKPMTPEIQEQLFFWRGRIQYDWQLIHSAVLNSSWSSQVRPVLEEAKTHYFMAFEQIKGIFTIPESDTAEVIYPISVEMWLELASQAVDSMYEMNDAALDVSHSYVASLKAQAQTGIAVSLAMFLFALFISYYSWRVITLRVIQPINSMVDTLYKATHGQPYNPPKIVNYDDEVGKLAVVLNVFQENSKQLEKERDRAEAANIAKSEFLANMSHEIRTPINVVLGLSTILGKTSPLSERQAEFIKTLQLSAESLLMIINDLLDFSKIETKNFELEHVAFSMESILDDVIALMSVKAAEKNLEFRADFSGIRGREYTGDPTRIKQILINLSGNAIKFTEKGSVVLKARASPAKKPDYEDICISVIDTGIGIEPEKLDVIFEKFTQADSSISRKHGGTGLGLAIAKAFTEMMGGEIKVESIFGQGTTFSVFLSLPVKRTVIENTTESIPDPEPRKENVAENQEKPRILLVDDYAPNVMVASIYLEQFGFECDVAENGLIALEKVKNRKYHAILMDVQMRELDGYQATHAIRKYEKQHNLPRTRIIGMTAHALTGDRKKCMDSGMDDYLAKPYHLEELKGKIAA